MDVRPEGGRYTQIKNALSERGGGRRDQITANIAEGLAPPLPEWVMALSAWIVYRRLGLSLLRTAWFNVDWLWAGALVVAGIVVLFK